MVAIFSADNTNLISAQVAKKLFKVPKVIARIYDPQRAHIYTSLGLDILSGTILFAAMIRDKIIESRFTSYLIETKELGVIELEIEKNFSGKSVKELNIPQEFMVVALRRFNEVFIPEHNTVVKEKDVLMGVVKVAKLKEVKATLGLQ